MVVIPAMSAVLVRDYLLCVLPRNITNHAVNLDERSNV